LIKYLYNPPIFIKKIFHKWIWNTSNDKILLTFDDGPIPETTPLILSALDKLRIKAAFFCVGNNIDKNPELAKEILSCGHEIGNHTYNHKIITQLNRAAAVNEIKSFINLTECKLDYKPKYFRPPHGRFNFMTDKIVTGLKQSVVMWSLLAYDYKNDLNLVKFVVTKFLKKNSIIVLHDSMKSREIILDSINMIMEQAAENGFEIGEPAECLK
jgi:peptidoglycan/xylan/chitin deacetylase (PgdA/CDA1 family)